MKKISAAAVELGRKGGKSTSEAKQTAARENGKSGGRPESQYFIVDAPGHYGDKGRVYSSHRSLQAAKKAVGSSKSVVIRKGHKTKGEMWLRVYEETYPVAR